MLGVGVLKWVSRLPEHGQGVVASWLQSCE